MANTTNFGWETPDDTDLVKDGAAAMRTLGNSIDASFVDLKGGTTGQILSKNSNTDLDYVWINNDQGDITAVTAGTGISGGGTSGAVTITNSMATEITASGDIIVGTGSGTFDNLPIGTTGQVLTADTTVSPYKVKWAATSTPNFVGAHIYNTASYTAISSGVSTIVAMDGELLDTDGFHSTTTNTARITIPSGKAGKYFLFAQVQWQTNENGNFEIKFHKNGNFINAPYVRHNGYAINQVNTYILDLAVGDYVDVRVYQASGVDRNIVGNGIGNGPITYFGAIYLGA